MVLRRCTYEYTALEIVKDTNDAQMYKDLKMCK